jgi:hypothetical protein
LNEILPEKQANPLQGTYNLSHTVNFATRVRISSSTAIDNIFLDSARLISSCTSIVNGISGHDAQFLIVNNIIFEVNSTPLKQKIRKINNETIARVQHLVNNEIWKNVFKNKDTNYKFNSYS